MSRPLNLARQPLRNERLPTLLLSAGCVLLLGLSVFHGLAARDLLPERTAAVDGELRSLEEERTRLRQEAVELAGRRATSEQVEEWAALRALVDRRTFSWSKLFGSLEEIVPRDVRLVSVVPSGEGGRVELELAAVCRTVAAGHEFLDVLQGSPQFEEPFPQSVGETADGVEFDITVGYVPQPAGAEEAR